MSLTINDVRRISDLARIDLSEESAKSSWASLMTFFPWSSRFSLSTQPVSLPMPHPFGGVQRLRPDDVTEHNRREENMQNAPDEMDGLFLVPKVIE